jgi:hypothetical protein
VADKASSAISLRATGRGHSGSLFAAADLAGQQAQADAKKPLAPLYDGTIE